MDVNDIIAQFDDEDVNDIDHDINVDDLLKEDLVASTLDNDDDDNDTTTDPITPPEQDQKPKPQLSSTLPTPTRQKIDKKLPIEPEEDDVEQELDIEKILYDSKMDDDMDPTNDELLDFDPYNIEDIKEDNDNIQQEDNNNKKMIDKYSDIDIESISNLLKREEIRIKQWMECGNYTMIEPLTKRMNNNNILNRKESFFKLELYENITKILENHRSEYGPPTFIKTHFKFIAIGMKNGSVFIFDHFQQLKIELKNNDSNNSQYNCVTSLDFNHNGTLLIVGYYNGQLILWDIINNKELKKIRDAHSSPIIYVIFYRIGTLKIASLDSNGIMFTWTFNKIFFSYQIDRNTLFNGKRAGRLYDISLYKPNPNHRHILDSLSLCAVANNESVFFVTLEPPFTLKQTILLPNTNINDIKRGALPMLAWRLSYSTPQKTSVTSGNSKPQVPTSLPPPIPNKNKKKDKTEHFHTYNPVLAVGSGTVIQLIEVFIRDENKFNLTRDTSLIRMRGIGQIQLNKLVISMRWLNEENLVILTANDEILICNGWPLSVSETIWPMPKPKYNQAFSSLSTLISPKANNNKATTKINIDFFIRHQYFDKHIISFKNCLEIIGGLDRTGQTNKLLIITNSNIVVSYCMTWYDRIDKLIKEGEWIKACCLIIEFFNKYQLGEIQQSSNVNKLISKIDKYIIQFCQFVVQSNKISDDELESFGGVAMDYCVNLNRCGSLLFDKVYTILLNNGGREIFFKLLEPYILNEKWQIYNGTNFETISHFNITSHIRTNTSLIFNGRINATAEIANNIIGYQAVTKDGNKNELLIVIATICGILVMSISIVAIILVIVKKYVFGDDDKIKANINENNKNNNTTQLQTNTKPATNSKLNINDQQKQSKCINELQIRIKKKSLSVYAYDDNRNSRNSIINSPHSRSSYADILPPTRPPPFSYFQQKVHYFL